MVDSGEGEAPTHTLAGFYEESESLVDAARLRGEEEGGTVDGLDEGS